MKSQNQKILTHPLGSHHARHLGVCSGRGTDGVERLWAGSWRAHGVGHVLEVWIGGVMDIVKLRLRCAIKLLFNHQKQVNTDINSPDTPKKFAASYFILITTDISHVIWCITTIFSIVWLMTSIYIYSAKMYKSKNLTTNNNNSDCSKKCGITWQVTYIIIWKIVVHTLGTHALGGPAGAGAELSKLIGRIVRAVLCLRRRNTVWAQPWKGVSLHLRLEDLEHLQPEPDTSNKI